jgi:hypothetical protein
VDKFSVEEGIAFAIVAGVTKESGGTGEAECAVTAPPDLGGVVGRLVSAGIATERACVVAVTVLVDVVVVMALLLVVAVVESLVSSSAMNFSPFISPDGVTDRGDGKDDGDIGATGADNLRGDFSLSCMTIGANTLGFRAGEPEFCEPISPPLFRLIVGNLGSIRGLVGIAPVPDCVCADGVDVVADVAVDVVDGITLLNAFESMTGLMLLGNGIDMGSRSRS